MLTLSDYDLTIIMSIIETQLINSYELYINSYVRAARNLPD
jgi:hypothetical protein